jgi:hypothetical protein
MDVRKESLKEFADVDEIVRTVSLLAGSFGGINLSALYVSDIVRLCLTVIFYSP